MKGKKGLALLLTVIMVWGLCACTPNPVASSTAQPTAPSIATEPTVPGGPAKPVVDEGGRTSYTYRSYTTALKENWNPHTCPEDEMGILGYLTTPLISVAVRDTATGQMQWVYDGAVSVTDVTATHRDDLIAYQVDVAQNENIRSVAEGYVFEIKLNPDMKWENGAAITADDYLYSMQQLLNPEMKNLHASRYFAGSAALAGAGRYYFSKESGVYKGVATMGYRSNGEALAAGEALYLNLWSFAGLKNAVDARGNACPQWENITSQQRYIDPASGKMVSAAGIYEVYADYLEVGTANASNIAILDANAFYGAGWDSVGLYKVDDHTLIYVCQSKTQWSDLMNKLTYGWLVYEPLYEAGLRSVGGQLTTNYGTSMSSTMSCGPWKMVFMESGRQVRFAQNQHWYGYEKDQYGNLLSFTDYLVDGAVLRQYQTTDIIIDIMPYSEAKQRFLEGKLSDWALQGSDLIVYGKSKFLQSESKGETLVFSLCCDSQWLQQLDKKWDNHNAVVLSNLNFRKALALAFNRRDFAPLNEPWEPVDYLQHSSVAIDGYNLLAAREQMSLACKELVEQGVYKAGDPIVLSIGKASKTDVALGQYQVDKLNRYINDALVGSGFGTLQLQLVDGSSGRFDDIPVGETAICWGAWNSSGVYPFVGTLDCWNPETETLTIQLEGQPIIKTWQQWNQSLTGNGVYAQASAEVKLQIETAMERAFLDGYCAIPFASVQDVVLVSRQLQSGSEPEATLRLTAWDYTDAQWAAYVESQNGRLNYR